MRQEIKNLAHSVHDRLSNLARDMEVPFYWVFQSYANERFLYRLSKSQYQKKFVLKGGLIFLAWRIPFRRFTNDIDLRAFTNNDLENISQIFKDICALPVEDDAMMYDSASVEVTAISEQTKYAGVRVKLWGYLGAKTKTRIQIDIGFSDEITPLPINIIFPTLLGMHEPELRGYPKETVVAEKFHSLVIRGRFNSRMNDFYDLWVLINHELFDRKMLCNAISSTFQNRNTKIPIDIPVSLTEEYAVDNQRQWQAFLNGFMHESSEVEDFTNVINSLRKYFLSPLSAIAQNQQFYFSWSAENLEWTKD